MIRKYQPTPERAAELDAYAAELVKDWPPVSPETRALLEVIWAPRRPDRAPRADRA